LSPAWATGLVRELDKFFLSLRSTFEIQQLLITKKGRRVGVTLVTAATYTILLTDDVIDVNRAGAVTLTLPESPGLGQRFQVQDGSGDASSNNITINESASIQVNGGSSVVLNTDNGRMVFIYNGTEYIAS